MTDGLIYRSWGDDPLPSRDVALASPLRAFKSWYLRMECGKCGRERWLAETHLSIPGKGGTLIRDLIPRFRHGERCGGEPHVVELITRHSRRPAAHSSDRPGRRAISANAHGVTAVDYPPAAAAQT